MIRLSAFAVSFLLTACAASWAHEITITEYDVQPLITDLNVVANYLARDELTNSDVAGIAGAACSAMRVVIREQFVERIGAQLQEAYASADEIAKVELGQFIAFEREALARFGATERAIQAVTQLIEENPKFPTAPPQEPDTFAAHVRAIEQTSCSRWIELSAASPDEPASAETASWGRCMGRGVIGMTVIVADVAIGLETGPIGIVLVSISGGWGWNRVEEACR